MGNNKQNYVCSACGAATPREKLTARRVSFQTLGVGFKTLKSKVTGWLCPTCREQDPVWNAPKWVGTPGHSEDSLADDGKAPV